ncbi:pilus assembly PilX family protein [Aeromonas sp. 164P]
MCHKPNAQRGSALMIALFVIVIMSLLAATLGRLLVDSGDKHTLDVRGTRAFLAAQSGLEVALSRLFPLSPASNSAFCLEVDKVDRLELNDAADPQIMTGCRASVSCKLVHETVSNTRSYRLVSEGACGLPDEGGESNPDFAVARTLTAEARAAD